MISITKASGERESFREEKLLDSLVRVDVKKSKAQKICKQVAKGLYPNISSGEILDNVIECLEQEDPSFAARYNLKRAMMELGPTGFPFEKFVSKVLGSYQYVTRTNVTLRGHCISHEVDVLAEKKDTSYLVECKYHNTRGLKTNVRTALYVWARFLDIEQRMRKAHPRKVFSPMLVTNTKCTSQARTYAKCVGMKVLAWRYPARGLERLIEQKNIYPVTVFPSLSSRMKRELISRDILFVRDILTHSLEEFVHIMPADKSLAQKIYLQATHLTKSS
jgi:hypothetical protein